MNNATKKCPMCAEEIKIDSRICPYCEAAFIISTRGYCSICRQVRDADENDHCQSCGAALIDLQIKSEYISEEAPPAPPPLQVDTPSVQAFPSPKKRSKPKFVRIASYFLILAGACILMVLYITPKMVPYFATETPRPTRTHTLTPTLTLTPTRTPTVTPTPLPIEITFDTISDYSTGTRVVMTGNLVMFSSTYCGYECGLSLAKFSGSSQTITIFVRVADAGVEPSPNQMKALPDPYDKWDIRVKLDDGEYAFIGQRITVTGRICETTDGDPCISDISKIELAN